MKKFGNIQYTEYSTEGACDYCATVRVKVNPYLAGTFLRMIREVNHESVVGAYGEDGGFINIDLINICYAKDACGKVSHITDIKYEFVTPKED